MKFGLGWLTIILAVLWVSLATLATHGVVSAEVGVFGGFCGLAAILCGILWGKLRWTRARARAAGAGWRESAR